MLNRKEVTVLKKVIKEITAKKVDRNFWIEDKGHTCFGMDYFFFKTQNGKHSTGSKHSNIFTKRRDVSPG